MAKDNPPQGFKDALNFPLFKALFGRRSRRVFLGAEIPDGTFRYTSPHKPMPLSPLEKMVVAGAVSGVSGFNYLIMRNARYAPHLSNYEGAAGGRTYPSAAGFHTTETFFTDDEGVYMLAGRDAYPSAETGPDGEPDMDALLADHARRVVKIRDGRLDLPPEPPYVEGHNTWVVNKPGSLLVIPVADLAQHALLGLCYYLQNGSVIYDDMNHRAIPGLEKFGHLADVDNPLPLTFFDQLNISEVTAELATSCYAGALALQAMGLGGWMFDGLDALAVLGASGRDDVKGLGFRYDLDERWPLPNVTGLPGLMEGFCPPHYPDMRAAVDAVCERKFGPGGPYNPETPGPWKDSARVRGSAQVHDEEFRECVALQAQYVFDTFGKFPAQGSSIFALTYLQAHHLDLDFYDKFYKPGSYLTTHAAHMEAWHGGED